MKSEKPGKVFRTFNTIGIYILSTIIFSTYAMSIASLA